MPAQISEDVLDLSIGFLETEPIAPGPSYPFSRLRPTGVTAIRSFPTLVIDNPFLRVTLLPTLGGRILRIFDKRTQCEILPDDGGSLASAAGGRRGARVERGLQLRLDGDDRLNSLGPVAFQVDEPQDEDNAAGAWLAETAMANGLGFHLHVCLPPDRAEIRIEARIHNRAYRPLPYDGELAIFFGRGDECGRAVYDSARDAGLGIHSDAPFDGVRFEDGVLRFARFGENRLLAPRQVDSWSATLVPFSGIGNLRCWSHEAAVGLDERRIALQTVSTRLGHKLVIVTEAGETLEAPVDLYPETVSRISISDLPSKPVGIAILDPARREVVRTDDVGAPIRTSNPRTNTPVTWPGLDSDPGQLRRDTFDVATRHLAHTLLGIRALRDGEYNVADREFERALLYNAEDPLLWWEKSLARRLGKSADDDRPELLNAHFLAPLEPALRAEALLTQPASGHDVPNPLLAGMAETPEEFVEVACLLIERERFDLAARWIGETLRHADLAMLHLLIAYCLLRGTKMDAEAADRVGKAARSAGPPYPWRDIERVALEALHSRFPADEHVFRLLDLCR